MNWTRLILVLITMVALTMGCSPKGDIIPTEPDYADTTQWYIVNRNAAVDLFYIVSTDCSDYQLEGKTIHYADTHNDSLRALLCGEMVGIDHLLAGQLNYYSPYYRQVTLETYTSDSLVEARMPIAYGDVRKAFSYYLEHYNQGRPFVLAGFSQGAMAVVDLLKTMDDSIYNRLVAAYVIGYKVTEPHPHIRPAADSTDLGVTICYNSVRDNNCALPILSEGNLMSINPVNWRTDATPALFIDPRHSDTLTITLDTTSRLLHISGYKHNDYMLPLIGREGNYHRLDLTLYADLLRRNIVCRAAAMQLRCY